MARRSVNWRKSLSEDLRDLEFAKEYVLALIFDNDMSFKEALKETVECYGYTEYAKLCGIKQPTLFKALNEESNITILTLEKILKPLNLDITLKSGEAA